MNIKPFKLKSPLSLRKMELKRGLFAVLFFGGFLFLINFVSADFIDSGDLVQNVTDCGVLNTTNATYTLNQSINSSFSCILVNATNITLDCANYNITFGNATGGFGVFVSGGSEGYNFVTIRNCYLIQNESGLNHSAILLESSSKHARIINNTIETYGNETYGVIIEDNSNNITISENVIYTEGSEAKGIFLGENVTDTMIQENVVITIGNDASGVVIGDSSSGIVTYNNTIWIFGNRTLENGMGGILLEVNTFDLNVSSNLVFAGYFNGSDYEPETEEIGYVLPPGGGYNSSCIWVWGNNSTIYGNLVISFGGDSGRGVFLSGVENVSLDSNTIIALGENGEGIYSIQSEMLVFYGNFIATLGENSSAISSSQDSDNNISFNEIATLGNYSHGIFFNESHNHTLTRNEIYTSESTSYVLYLTTSAGELIYDNLFNTSTNGSGIYITSSDPSDFNTTKTSGTNIVGKSYIGGNFYTNSSGTGYSDTCTESGGDYICDSEYQVVEGVDIFDYLPLTLFTSYVVENEGSGSSTSGGCTTKWVCTEWGSCIDGVQTRNCTKEKPYCYVSIMKKPLEVKNCSDSNLLEGSPDSSSDEEVQVTEKEIARSFLWVVSPIVVAGVLIFLFYKYFRKRK